MKYVLAVLSLVALAGCATNPSVPGVVEVPIIVKCTTPDPIQPTYRFNPPYTSLFEGTRDLLGDREASLSYEIELRAALKSCK